ncbi:hypothetical protein [Sphingomonas sp.]|uniref:hypothetical protein n=1 Tax=Sphingomonas sp. TaxID=28214 RepID=UPI003CC62C80
MAATYRLKGFGWLALLAAVALGCYLVSLQVAAEHRRLDDANARIAVAQRDLRALETEFDTRANLAQLERWNGDTLALAAPTAAQFVASDAALAALDPTGPGQVRTAALLVPTVAPAAVAPPLPTRPATAPAEPLPVAVARVEMPRPAVIPAVEMVAPTGRAAPALARAVEAARGMVAVARVRPQAVAMLDRQLLSPTTFGDLASGARREAQR